MEQVPVVSPGDELIAALEAIAHSIPGRALVLDDDRLVGLLSSADVRRALEVRGYRVVSAQNGSRA
jgi:CBS domain-containing protein